MNNKAIQLAAVLVVLSLGAFALSHQSYKAYQHPDSLKMWVLDVGQGDAILLDTPDNKHILIDGGPDNSVLSQLQRALPVGVKELTAIISTHDDADHLSGINQVIQHYTVDKIILSGAVDSTQTYKTFVSLVAKYNIPLEKVHAGASIDEGDLHGVVIWPLVSQDGRQPVEQNTISVVVYWQYGEETILTEGDAQAEQEQQMLGTGFIRPVDILKVGHHGSATSSTESFLKALSPKLAVISVGRNNTYNLPNPGVIDRFKRLGIPVVRTDQHGTIEITITKNSFSYQ